MDDSIIKGDSTRRRRVWRSMRDLEGLLCRH